MSTPTSFQSVSETAREVTRLIRTINALTHEVANVDTTSQIVSSTQLPRELREEIEMLLEAPEDSSEEDFEEDNEPIAVVAPPIRIVPQTPAKQPQKTTPVVPKKTPEEIAKEARKKAQREFRIEKEKVIEREIEIINEKIRIQYDYEPALNTIDDLHIIVLTLQKYAMPPEDEEDKLTPARLQELQSFCVLRGFQTATIQQCVAFFTRFCNTKRFSLMEFLHGPYFGKGDEGIFTNSTMTYDDVCFYFLHIRRDFASICDVECPFMFANCINITAFPPYISFNNVYEATSFAEGCINLKGFSEFQRFLSVSYGGSFAANCFSLEYLPEDEMLPFVTAFEYGFLNCFSLTEVSDASTFPFADEAFNLFDGCVSLRSVSPAMSLPYLSTCDDRNLPREFEHRKDANGNLPKSLQMEIVPPPGVVRIDDGDDDLRCLFDDCFSLESIPHGVRERIATVRYDSGRYRKRYVVFTTKLSQCQRYNLLRYLVATSMAAFTRSFNEAGRETGPGTVSEKAKESIDAALGSLRRRLDNYNEDRARGRSIARRIEMERFNENMREDREKSLRRRRVAPPPPPRTLSGPITKRSRKQFPEYNPDRSEK